MASYTAITKYQSSNGGDWVEIKLVWSYTNTATTATISAALYVRRDSYGPTEGNDQYWISLNGTKFVNSSGYHTISTNYTSEPICSGSTTINLINSGASATSLTLDGYYNNNLSSTKLHALRVNKANYSGGYWTTSYGTQGSPLSATIPAQTSACGAPTSVTASGIITQNGTFTVSWSGASSGTNNSISSYQVYYRISSNGTVPTTASGGYTVTKNVPSTSTYGSTTFTVSGATRGHIISCGVVTRGSAGEAYYSGIKTGGSVRINDLPNAPSIKTDAYANYSGTSKTQYIISTKTTVSVTATVGSDTYSVSTPVVKHNTSNSHSGEGNFTSDTLGPGTHYFWTFDGLEYSSTTTLTITQLAKPTITKKPEITNSTYTAKNSNTYTYQVSFGNIVSIFSRGKYYIQYWMRVGSSGGEWKDYTSGDFSATTFNPGKTFAFESYLPATVTSDYSFWFRVRTSITDTAGSIDYSAWWYYGANSAGTETGEKEYKYAGPWSNPSVSTGVSNFSFSITDDTRLTSWTVTAKKGSANFPLSKVTTSISGNNRTFSIESGDSSGSTITYTITGTNGEVTKSTSFTRTIREKTIISSISFSLGTMYAFRSNSGDLKISGKRGNDFSTTNLTSTKIEAIGAATVDTGKGFNIAVSASTDFTNASITINMADIFNPTSKTLGIALASRYGTTTFTLKVTFTNKYSESITAETGKITLNFDETPTFNNDFFTTNNAIAYSNTSSAFTPSSSNLLGSHLMQEGMYLKFKYQIKNYTYRDVTVKIERSTSSTGSNSITVLTQSIGASTITQNSRTQKETTDWITTSYKMPENSYSKLYWKLTITQSGTSASSNSGWIEVNAIAHTQITGLKLNTLIADNINNKYNLSYTCTALGIATSSNNPIRTAKIQLQYDSSGTGSWANIGNSFNAAVSSTAIDTAVSTSILQQTKSFRIVLNTTCSSSGGYIAKTKSSLSNTIVVYVEEPTIAYRHNQVGINNKAPVLDAVLDIATASSKETIYIRHGDNVMLKINFEGTNTTILDIP